MCGVTTGPKYFVDATGEPGEHPAGALPQAPSTIASGECLDTLFSAYRPISAKFFFAVRLPG
jgi:hypothetical protein